VIFGALLVCALLGLVSSTVYLGLVAVAARRFRARIKAQSRTANVHPQPSVSVLKPVYGAEPRLSECLESFFRQEYQDFEIVFAARDLDDAAWDVVNALRQKYPGVRTQSIVCGEPVHPNAKVSALEAMVARAAFPYLVIADSDALVPPDCVTRLVRPLVDPAVGLVTCLYRGVPTGGLSTRLEALAMSVEMPSGVLVADMLEGMRFALGPAIATRKDVIQMLGGIGVLGSYCADDYVLGYLVHAAGKAVILSDEVIDHVVVNRSAGDSLQHQMRWMRSTRFSRTWGHIGTGLTFAMPFGVLGLLAAGGNGRWALAVSLAAWGAANRIVQCLLVGWWTLGDAEALTWCWLYPIRDLLGFFIWCGSFLGAHIVWRGERYELMAGGLMRALKS
jgi:ceramide glucosyltransferase